MDFECQTLQQGYAGVLQDVMRRGSDVTVKNVRTKEVLGYSLRVVDPTSSLPLGTGRGVNKAIGFGEALQLVSGESYPDLMGKVSNRTFYAFRDGEVLHGSYGPRLRPQIPRLIEQLRSVKNSRQGVLNIWDPIYDQQERRDIPCTVALQLLARDDKLHMCVYMRSNDAWLGLAYDVFQFTTLQCTIANVLGFGYGTYTHFAGSMHVYEKHWDRVDSLTTAPDGSLTRYEGVTATTWHEAQWVSNLVLQGKLPTGLSRFENEANEVFKAYQ